MPKRPKETKTIVPGIADSLRNLIWKGKLRPGEHLNQEAWAATLGVSHIPFREAVRILEAEGLMAFSPNRGISIKPVTAQELEEWALEFFGLMHVLMPLAVARATPEALARARVIARDLDLARIPAEAHLEFWRILFKPCDMPRLQSLLDQLIWRLGRYFLADGKALFAAMKDRHPNREDFLDAIEAGDVEGARRAVMGFVLARKEGYLQVLAEDTGPWGNEGPLSR